MTFDRLWAGAERWGMDLDLEEEYTVATISKHRTGEEFMVGAELRSNRKQGEISTGE